MPLPKESNMTKIVRQRIRNAMCPWCPSQKPTDYLVYVLAYEPCLSSSSAATHGLTPTTVPVRSESFDKSL
uniref:Uncharacterized protein n=1 Tax=Trichuris muris TaxID=70415 RepID=A0A5S6Q6D0_TRIMR